MEKILAVLKSTQAKRFYWTTADGLIALAIVAVGEFDAVWVPILTAILISITKEINNRLSQ
jgi:hypothetical protein